MRILLIFCFTFTVTVVLFAQSKKELNLKIIQLEQDIIVFKDTISKLKKENEELKSSLSYSTYQINQVYEAFAAKNDSNHKVIVGYIRQIDSLQNIINNNLNKRNQKGLNLSDSVLILLDNYFTSNTIDEKLKYILKPDVNRLFLVDFYKDSISTFKIIKNEIFIQPTKAPLYETFKVKYFSRIIYIARTLDGFKIDWLATNGYNPVSLNSFVDNSISKPTQFRVFVQSENQYKCSYAKSKDKYLNLSVRDANNSKYKDCYVSRDSEDGKILEKLLSDGEEHQVILEIIVDLKEQKCPKTILVNKFIQEGWSKE